MDLYLFRVLFDHYWRALSPLSFLSNQNSPLNRSISWKQRHSGEQSIERETQVCIQNATFTYTLYNQIGTSIQPNSRIPKFRTLLKETNHSRCKAAIWYVRVYIDRPFSYWKEHLLNAAEYYNMCSIVQ